MPVGIKIIKIIITVTKVLLLSFVFILVNELTFFLVRVFVLGQDNNTDASIALGLPAAEFPMLNVITLNS